MSKKLLSIALLIIPILSTTSVYADRDNSCEVHVAVSTPPIPSTSSVAFNVTNDLGINKSIILHAGDAPQTISKLMCGEMIGYFISATQFSNLPDTLLTQFPTVGQCVLKANPVVFGYSNNSIAVVFPNDFMCNNNQ